MGVSNIANLAGSSFTAGSSGKIPQDVHVVDANGTPVSFGGSGGTSSTDEATYTPTSSTGTPVMGAVDETTPDAAAEGSLAIVRSTLNRALHVNLRDASGNEVSVGGGTQYTEGDTDASLTGNVLLFEGAADTVVAAPGTAANGLDVDVTRVQGTVTVDGSGVTQPVSGTVTANLAAGTNNIGDVDVLSVVPGTGATNLGKAEDAAHSSGDTGVMALAVRSDAGGAIAGTDGDYTPLQVDSAGALRVTGGGGGTEYTEGDTDATLTGSVFLFETNTGTSAVGPVSSAAPLPVTLANTGANATPIVVDLGANNDVAVTGTVTANAGTGPFPVSDNAGSLTVDAPVGTPVFVRLSDGSAAITTLPVSLASVPSHAVTNAGTFSVQESGGALTALQLLDNTIFVDDAAFTPGTSSVSMAGFQADETATDSVNEGDAGAARMTLDRKIITTPQPHTAGGLSIFRSLDLDESEEEIKASAGQVYGVWFSNTATSTRWLKFYNATAASVTVGTTTPVLTLALPGNSSDDISGVFSTTHGIAFGTAITVAATTGVADADTGAPAANDVIVNIFYA
jgi:hypothetical protein